MPLGEAITTGNGAVKPAFPGRGRMKAAPCGSAHHSGTSAGERGEGKAALQLQQGGKTPKINSDLGYAETRTVPEEFTSRDGDQRRSPASRYAGQICADAGLAGRQLSAPRVYREGKHPKKVLFCKTSHVPSLDTSFPVAV